MGALINKLKIMDTISKIFTTTDNNNNGNNIKISTIEIFTSSNKEINLDKDLTKIHLKIFLTKEMTITINTNKEYIKSTETNLEELITKK